MENLTKDDVLSLKAGEIKSYGLKDNHACNAAKVCIQYVKRVYREKMTEKGISAYKARVNWDQSIITIQAVEL